MFISIHLMLLFILSGNSNTAINLSISIHLMLLFICHSNITGNLYSNISIHLMLLFIGLFNLATKGCDSFQYISCYCLSLFIYCIPLPFLISIHLMLLFIQIQNPNRRNGTYFNTSHVTVYPPSCAYILTAN